MRCEEFEENITAYLDEELSPHLTQAFHEHLSTCDRCRRCLEGIRTIRATLFEMGQQAPPPSFQLRATSRIQSAQALPWGPWFRPLLVGLAVAAALLIMLWPEPGPDHVASLPPPSLWKGQAAAWVASSQPVPWADGAAPYAPYHKRPGRYSHAQARLVSY